MSNKRSLLVTLLLALVLPILAACGGSDAGTNTETSAVASAPVIEASAPATEASMEASPMASMEASMEASPMASMEASGSASAAASAAGSAAAGGGEVIGTDFSKIQVEDGATLTVTSWGDPSEQEINQESIQRFNEIFPNVTVNYQPNPSDYATKIKADFAAGTNADVFYVDAALMTALAPNQLLLDLTPYMEQVGVNREDYIGQLTEIFVQDGKTYGLPKDQGALVLFVNNALAEKAGIKPEEITSWDDWKAAAEKMNAEGVNGQCLASEWQRLGALWLQQPGVQAVQDGKANFTDPKLVEATNFWNDFYKNKTGVLPKEIGADWCGQAFGQGKTAMVMEGGWMLPYLEKDFPDLEYTAVPIPTPPGGTQASLVFTNAWGAAANTKFPNAAAALALFLTSPQNQKPIMETGFALPTVKTLLEDPYFEENPNAKVVAEAGQYGTPANLALGSPAVYDDVAKALNTQIEQLFLGGGETQTILENAQMEAQGVLDSAPQ